jgi:hypothetical protein
MICGVNQVNDAGPLSRSTTLGWVVLGLVVATLPLEIGWFAVRGSEPYPALLMPLFPSVPGADGVFAGQATSLSVVLSDGSEVPIPGPPQGTAVPEDYLFTESKNQAPSVVASLVSSPSLDERSRKNLRAELSRFVPGKDISALRIDTQRREYRPRENTRYPTSATETIVIDLGATS